MALMTASLGSPRHIITIVIKIIIINQLLEPYLQAGAEGSVKHTCHVVLTGTPVIASLLAETGVRGRAEGGGVLLIKESL